jgi:GT2 family glycosyltransferase
MTAVTTVLPSATADLPPELAAVDGVRHVALAPGETPAAAIEPGMTVFWQNGRAVGHLLALPDGSRRTALPDDPAPMPIAQFQAGPTASVVICTRDRPDELARCLASLPRQSYSPAEIIVVDNASRDGRTRQVAEAAGVIYVREDRPGLDIARNTGAKRAAGEIVAYTDDDVLLHPRWLERLVASFDDPSLGAVTGLVLPGELATEAQLHFETYWSFGQGYRRRDFTAAMFAAEPYEVFPVWQIGAGASMAFRRSAIEAVGLFDERLDVGRAGCSGDSEMWYRLLAAGFGCRYEPSAIAFHFHRRAMDGLASQIFHYMRGHSAALLVQYERTNIRANRALALWGKPQWYAGRLFNAFVRRRRRPEDRFLLEEVRGYLSGLIFYARHRHVR